MVDPVDWSKTAGDCESAIISDDIPLFQSQAFLNRVYLTLTLQFLITSTTLIVSLSLITDFGSSYTNLAVHIVSGVTLFIGLNFAYLSVFKICFRGWKWNVLIGSITSFSPTLPGIGLLYKYREESPANYVLLCLCTVGVSYLVALSSAYFVAAAGRIPGLKIFLESWCLTSIMFASLSCHALKAARKGIDFRFLELYLLKAALALILLLLFLLILNPPGKLSCHLIIMAGFGSALYSMYIVYFTNGLVIVTRFPYEQHIWASMSLYIYVVALFLFFFLLIADA